MSSLTFVYARPLFALMAIVAALLLLACTNVAGLLLARGAARQREMAVRVSLGAGRLRLVRQVLTESLLLAAAGCLLGIVLAYFGADALMRVVTSGRMPGMAAHVEIQPQLDLRVLLFTVGVSLATGILFGLAPALSACHSAPAASLRATGAAPETPLRRLDRQGPRRRAGGAVDRAVDRRRTVRTSHVDAPKRRPRLPARVRAAADAGSRRQRLPGESTRADLPSAARAARGDSRRALRDAERHHAGLGQWRVTVHRRAGVSGTSGGPPARGVELDRAEVLRNARHAGAGGARFHLRGPARSAGGDREPVDGAILLRRSQPHRTTLHVRAPGQSGDGAGAAVPDCRRRRRHEILEPAGADTRGWST